MGNEIPVGLLQVTHGKGPLETGVGVVLNGISSLGVEGVLIPGRRGLGFLKSIFFKLAGESSSC